MTAHLIIQQRHGRLSWAIGYDIEGQLKDPDPKPVAEIPLTDGDLAMGGRALFDRWVREHVPVESAPAPTSTQADIASVVKHLSSEAKIYKEASRAVNKIYGPEADSFERVAAWLEDQANDP